ncbi:MAG: SusC/RagA family TonB-linked outer membrane protein [Reichenbachiella sp.]|uniref:SusC/RagA family TonB-linked outer membrane protein n=1 Tax=Reichenbachiella sp. TaxID=2184521 RepID=UPI0032988DDB
MKKVYSALTVMLMLSVSVAFAQKTVSGTVTDGSSGEPLVGVNVIVKGSANGALTDLDGNYRLEATEGSILMFSFVGYGTSEATVGTANTIDISLTEDVTSLDEVVVTGLATSVKRSNLASSVATVNAKTLTGITNQSNMDGALYGKFKGADIRSNSGAPGGGISMRLRGVTSIFGDQQPLFIVDGVYVDNSTVSMGNNIVSEAAGGGNPSTNQDDATNRIADIDPEDIENIEILKGASAAAIYGSRAAGGVVIITTKRGKAGKTVVSLNQTVGLRQATQLLGLRDWTPATAGAIGGQAAADAVTNGTLRDYEDEIFGSTRVSNTTRLSISGGQGNTDYFAGITYKNEPGLVENTGYEKGSFRLNIGQKFNDWLDIYLTNNYINSTSDRGFFNNGNQNRTIGYALAFTYPWEDLSPVNGEYPAGGAGSNALETIALTTNREQVNRYIGGATANIKLLTQKNNQLKMVLQAGLDQYSLRTTSIFPQALSYFSDPNSLRGASISGSTVNTNYNLTATLVHSLYMDNGLSFTTQAGSFIQDFDRNTVITTATSLIGSQTNLGQSTNVGTQQTIRPQQDKGFFVQEEINFDDKIIGTLGIRGDKSTNNGDANAMYYYPKASLAVNLHEFDFWSVDAVSNIKPRVAYGQSGRFANFNDRFTVMNAQLIGGVSGVSPGNLEGNPDVGPERQIELEYGADIGFLDNRIGLDLTFYNKKMEDVLLLVNIPTSSGFTQRVNNAAELENKGIEIGLDASIIQTSDFKWNASVKWWRNRSKVTRLDVPAFNTGGFAASLGTMRIQEGKSATQIVGTYIASDFTADEIAEFDPEGDGFRVYGDAEADFQTSLYNQISWKNFDFTFLLHWKKGGDAINLTTLLYDLAGTTWDYEDTGLDPEGILNNGDYRSSQAFANPEPVIEDAGYLRLREVGVFYTLPKNLVPQVNKIKVGFSGRNLINIFDYNSYDPESSNFGNNVLANNVEVTPYPASRFYNFHLNVTF